MKMETVVRQFTENQLAVVHMPGSDSLIRGNLITAFRGFQHLPKETKTRIALDWDEARQVFDTGYSERTDDERKIVFHYKLGMEDELDAKEIPWKEAAGLFYIARDSWHMGYKVALEFARAFDRFHKGPSLVEGISSTENMKKHKVRILDYVGGTADPKVIAKHHTDVGGITITLGESWPAVEANGVVLEPQKDHGFIFPGQKLEKLTEGRIPALLHGVVERRLADRGPSDRRWSAVMFLHPF